MKITVPVLNTLRILTFLGVLTVHTQTSFSQGQDAYQIREVQIEDIRVEGASTLTEEQFVIQTSGLKKGQTVSMPGDLTLTESIRSIYRLGKYVDVKILEDRHGPETSHLIIQVQETPRIGSYTISGIKKSHRSELEKRVPLLVRTPLKRANINRAVGIIKEFYAEKGYPIARIDVEETQNNTGTVDLVFNVDRGKRAEIKDISINGNGAISERKLLKKLKTKEDKWWRFWKKATFDEATFEQDQNELITLLNERGYYDARILRDSVYLAFEQHQPQPLAGASYINQAGDTVYVSREDSAITPSSPNYHVALDLYEGPQYHIRSVEWEGNTIYSNDQLSHALGIRPGDVYNGTRLEENLFANRTSTDVSSLYMNQGYMTFRVTPSIRIVDGDSLDLNIDIAEGDIYQFGSIEISGNEKTRDHVVRRELYTIPGQTFSRDAIQESIRRLMQLSYFSQESLGAGPGVEIDDQQKLVNLRYSLEETGNDQLQLSGTLASYGLVLSVGFEFNNFSLQNIFRGKAWRPLPAGDGQKLSLGVQTSGSNYQNYSIGFTEPWLRGKPTPIGFNLSYTRIGENALSSLGTGSFSSISARSFYEKRLKWPDDKFSLSTSIGYQLYNNDGLYTTLPDGRSEEVTVQQALTRNSTDHPLFPTRGSNFLFSVTVAPPIQGFIQYHKWRLKNTWHVPLANKLSLSLSADMGYIGSLTGDNVEFQRFIVGGSPFDAQGSNSAQFLGTDLIFMRGYPAGSIGPRLDNEAIGGRILNKFTSELRYMAISTEQLQAAPYLFMDAANAWDRFSRYNPAELYRSAGVGMRFFLPILGTLELTYGYNFDTFTPLSTNDHSGQNKWLFQFTIGRGFD